MHVPSFDDGPVPSISSCGNKTKPATSQASPDSAFDNFKNYYVEEWFRISPGSALNAGRHDFDNVLQVPTMALIEEQDNKCLALLDSLHKFNEHQLSDANRIDLQMMRDNLNSKSGMIKISGRTNGTLHFYMLQADLQKY